MNKDNQLYYSLAPSRGKGVRRAGKGLLLFAILLSSFFFLACTSDQEDIFSTSSSLRMQDVLDKTKAALTGNENGWALDYYPDRNLTYGGIAYAIQFKGTEATVYSQESDKSETSLYKLTNDDGPVLSFDTYNSLMHAYATPSSSEYEAKDGDFEFIIMDVQNDLITLKGKRSGNLMYMHRLNQSAKEYITDVQKMEKRMLFSKYALVVDGDSINIKRNKNVFTFTDPNTGESTKIPFITTTTGFEFKDTVNIMGKSVTGFLYSEDGIWANPTDNSVALVSLPQPLTEHLTTNYWFFKASSMSEQTLKYFNVAKNGSLSEGEDIVLMLLGPNDYLDYSGAFGFSFISGNYFGSLPIYADVITDNIITFGYTYKSEGNGLWYFTNANYNYIISILCNANNSATYTLTSDNPTNPSWIRMEQMENPEIYFTVYKEEIEMPFEN